MISVGSLEVHSQDDILVLRNKTRLLALHLQFSEIAATRMASFVSEMCRVIGVQNLSSVQFLLQEEDNVTLVSEFSYRENVSFDLTESFDRFFDNVILSSNNEYAVVHLMKVVPESFEGVTDQLLEEVKALIIRLSEQELLAELERKNVQLGEAYEALKRSQQELLSRTAQLAKVGGWEINLQDSSLSWTEEVYRIHELPTDSKPKLEDGINYYAPEARPVMIAAINEAMEQGTPWDLELPFITAKGNHKWVRAMGFPERDGSTTVRLSGMFQDITDKKKVEVELEQKNGRLEFQNKEMEQFVYVASHDLQEPLRTIAGYVELLDEMFGDHLDESNKQYVSYIVDATHRMKLLIKDLLDYSRLGRSTDGRSTDMEVVDSRALIEAILTDLSHSINACDAIVMLPSELPMVRCHKIGLKQLFQNLISNAIKFRQPDIPPRVEISVVQDTNGWEFAVKDNGIGIEKQHTDRIFTIFQRLHTRDEYAGTGIGLALCKKVVELHGGKIWLDSEFGVGSSFYFTIPKGSVM